MLSLTHTRQTQHLYLSLPGRTVTANPRSNAGQQSESVLFASRDTISMTLFSSVEESNRLAIDRVIEQINEHLAETPGFVPIEQVKPADTTPEKTATFIVTATTSFFAAYSENHSEKSGKALLDGFLGLIRPAIEEGFRQAREILLGLDALNDDIGAGIDQTFELIQQKLDDFHADQLQRLEEIAIEQSNGETAVGSEEME